MPASSKRETLLAGKTISYKPLAEAFDLLGQELMATDVPDRTRANMQGAQDRIKLVLQAAGEWPPKAVNR